MSRNSTTIKQIYPNTSVKAQPPEALRAARSIKGGNVTSQLEIIREKIRRLYQTNPSVHLNVSLKSPKITLENTEAKITGVYQHIFQIEEYTSGSPKRHTLQYTDVFVRNIVILELENGKE